MTELPPGASPVDAISPGTRLREWEVLGFRGRGSYGVVFEARRSSWLDEPARALKVFDPIVSTAARHALVREFSTLTAVRHPHLLAGIDAFDVEEPPFTGCVVFVLELADEDLAQRVARAGALPPHEVAAIGADVAAGLGTLHARGHVHGDVKPENILRVGPRWTLGDFGVTGLLEGSYAVTPGATIDYRPPEAADAPDGAPRHRGADVWALGVTLHVAATARHPFRGPDPMMRYASVLRGDRAVPPVAPDGRLARIVDAGCLAPDPRQRLEAAALESQLRGLIGASRQVDAADAADAAGGDHDRGRGVAVPPDPPSPRRPVAPRAETGARRWITALVSAVVGVAIAQAVALVAGELPFDLNVRRAVYLVMSSAALAVVTVVASRRWLRTSRPETWTVGAGIAGWAAATVVLFGFVG